MSSVSLSGGVPATLFASLQKPQATDRSQQLFSKLDTNGDGSIDSTELKTFADDLGSKTGTKIDAGSLMAALDSDGDGSVSSTELKDNGKALFDQLRQQLMGSQMQATAQPPDADKLFSSIDADGDGSISKSELESFMSQHADGAGKGPHGPHGPPPGGPPPAAQSQDSSDTSTSDASNIISKLVASLIAQYGASTSDAATSSSTLSVAA
ncbi:MAG: EF-hand domain-containing protein [Pseudomonadota bacterium]